MKTITGIILLLTSLQSFAVCQSTDVVYESEGDDEGVTLEHVYTCDADGEELCIYSNSDMASVTGSLGGNHISTSELYRRKYQVKESKVRIVSMTSIWGSFFDHQDVIVNLDLQTMSGDISVTGDGVDPYSDKVKSTLSASITCK
ncbi:MAG: hypothetical protein CME64_08690 [Halobacteriovoraceae bacterium]|nr:hypothetical protein [Halobacteriovoraceae bacterium]|tara:strand:- start:280418 stop:280852 length:435 start_codon:yes stop_codon:yes gene_type:complete